MSDELPQWVEDLIGDLRESRSEIRRHAATNLGKSGNRHHRVADSLRTLRLNDPDQSVREAATAALRRLGLSLEPEQPPYPPAAVEVLGTPAQAMALPRSSQPVQAPMPSSPPNSPEYVFALEKRIMVLEIELNNLRQASASSLTGPSSAMAGLPNSALFSRSYLTRAFAVWGHYLVAQLLIVIPFYVLFLLLLGS